MRKYVIDFVFNEKTGESDIVIDFIDDSMTTLELNEDISSGEARERAIEIAGKVFGEEIANQAREGKIGIVCLDHHPEAVEDAPLIPIAHELAQKKDLKQ